MLAAPLIARFGQPLTITRATGAPTDDGHGRVVPAPTAPLTVTASVQPITGADLLRLPEGLRARELIKVYTATPLQTLNDAAGTVADTLAWNGSTYQVAHVEAWQGHWKCTAAKVPS